jgi:5-(carboxyamino)imidazole ribonucleotide synthase
MSGPLLPGDVDAQGRPLMLGVMGGGQLGRMFVHAAQALGFQTAVLDPDPHSPAGRVSHLHVRAPYLATDALEQMQHRCAALTTEFENVPAQALRQLAATRPVAPSGDAVAVCQHRALEKAHFVRSGVPCAPHARLEQEADLAAIGDDLFPAILKTSTLGYDGKGQVRLQSRSELASAWDTLQRVPCLLEKRVDLALELSVIVARDAQGSMVNLPVQQNLHRDGILAVTLVPAPDVSPALAEQAIANARAVAQSLDYVGVLCVEFFVLKDGTLVANEMAPRPHNSGHYSIDACDHSQFDLQVRAMAGLPLVQPRLHSPAVMLNLLGDLWYPSADSDATRTPPWAQVLALPGVHLHLYGKSEPRRARKMGHLTVTAASMDEALNVVAQAARLLGLPAPV